MKAFNVVVTVTCLWLISMPVFAQEDDAKSSKKSGLATIATMSPGVYSIQKDKKGRITSCIVVGRSRISTALGKAKGLEVARKRADLSATAEFVKWLKQDVTVVEDADDETVSLLEGAVEDNKDTPNDSGKAVEKTGSKYKSISQGLVRGLEVLDVKTEGENKTMTIVKGWKATTSEAVKRVASDSKKDDADADESGTSKSGSKKTKSKRGDREISDSEVTSPDADDYFPKKRSD
jgi:hypothetical protein